MTLLFLNSFQPDLYRAPFERNILVMLPILDDVAQSQNILIYRRYDFFIAKHMWNPGADPWFLVVLVLFFVIIFQIQSQSFYFYFIKNREAPKLRNHITLSSTTGSFIATIFVNLAIFNKIKMSRPFEDVKSDQISVCSAPTY